MRLLLIALAFFLTLPVCGPAASQQAPDLTWQSFEEAAAAARQSGKKMLVAVYAPWCGWCRKLDREVYTDPAVRRYLSEHFEAARLNGDDRETRHRFKGHRLTGQQLAQYLGTRGFPNTVFLTSDSEYITALPGYVSADRFLEVLRLIETGAAHR